MILMKEGQKLKIENGKKHRPRVLFNIHLLTDEEKKKRDDEQDAAD